MEMFKEKYSKVGKQMNIAIVGFGGVGKALVKLLNDKERHLKERYDIDISVKYIIKSDGGLYDKNGLDLKIIQSFIENGKNISEHNKWIEKLSIDDIIQKNEEIDTLIELTSTNIINGQPGLSHIEKALNNNINVVTGNKGPILLKYKELNNIALKNNAKLMVGCTTGGALPSITSGIYDLAGAEIKAIEGILNGTTNYILSEMLESNRGYEESLLKAQELGIAEANPKLDVEGFDTASKLLILSNVLMKTELSLKDVEVQGIVNIKSSKLIEAKAKGHKIKLIGKVKKEGSYIKVFVKPMEIDKFHPLYNVDNKNKGVYFKTDTLGDISLIGGASGTINAAASILRDIILIE